MRLLIVTNSSQITDKERDLITAYLEGRGWSVWHWFRDLWLIDNVEDGVSKVTLREQIRDLLPSNHHIFISGVEGDLDHAAWVPTTSIPWLKEHWRRR